jgi:tRNA-2-methylthio-N6-dimethylallyladenosine synthase
LHIVLSIAYYLPVRLGKTYHIWTIGCQMNDADSRRLAQQLEFIGYVHEPVADEADLVVLNTCVVRQQAEDKAASRLSTLKGAKARRPETVIGLMGCMVGMREAPRLRERFPFVDVFMPPSDTAPLLDFLEARGALQDARALDTGERALRNALQDEDLPLPASGDGRPVAAHVPAVLGCSHACTFCVIPYRRGAERSRRPGEILSEVRSLVRQGVREVTLLGQIVDRYGVDFDDGSSLPGLLRQLAAIDGLFRIRFLTSHPNYMTDDLLETVASVDKVCPQIEVPVQAGDDEVLARMRRGYTRERYRELVARIRSFVPGAAIHTDIIVGFPGETEAQFLRTRDLLAELTLDKAHLSKYSERPKTIAARQLPDDVPEDEKERRWAILEDLQCSIQAGKNNSLRGATVQVLVESLHKGKWRGRTPHNKLVFFEHPSDCAGRLVDVEVEWSSPFALIGRPAATRGAPALCSSGHRSSEI